MVTRCRQVSHDHNKYHAWQPYLLDGYVTPGPQLARAVKPKAKAKASAKSAEKPKRKRGKKVKPNADDEEAGDDDDEHR